MEARVQELEKANEALRSEVHEVRAELVLAQNELMRVMAENARQSSDADHQIQMLVSRIDEYRQVAEHNIELVNAIQNSRSYKLTAPLRRLRERF